MLTVHDVVVFLMGALAALCGVALALGVLYLAARRLDLLCKEYGI